MAIVIDVPRDLTDSTGTPCEAAQFHPVDAADRAFSEAWLQEVLRRYPGVLPVEEFGSVFHPLVPIGREMPTEAGPIDNLFISPAGYLVLVETKLWRNPEAKREVVAQLIDYAMALSRLTYERLDQLVTDYLARYEGRTSTLEGWVEEHFGPVDVGFQGRVARNLKLGRLLLLIVTDHARSAVSELLSRVNSHAALSMDMGVVELRPFTRVGSSDQGVLLVPYVAGRTEIVERSIVEVTVRGAPDAQVAVRQDRYEDEAIRAKRIPLKSEDAFWELMTEQAPQSMASGRTLVDKFRGDERFSLSLRKASVVVESEIPEAEVALSLFFLRSDGRLVCWPETVRRRLRVAGLAESLADEYVTSMRTILNSASGQEPSRTVNEVGLELLYEAARRFVMRVEQQHATN